MFQFFPEKIFVLTECKDSSQRYLYQCNDGSGNTYPVQIEGFPDEKAPTAIAIIDKSKEGQALPTHYYNATPEGYGRFLEKQVIELKSDDPNQKPDWQSAFILFAPNAFSAQETRHQQNLNNSLSLIMAMLQSGLEGAGNLVAVVLKIEIVQCKNPGEKCLIDSVTIARNPGANPNNEHQYNLIALSFHLIGPDEIHVQTGFDNEGMIVNPEQNAVTVFKGSNTRSMIVRGEKAKKIYQMLGQAKINYQFYP